MGEGGALFKPLETGRNLHGAGSFRFIPSCAACGYSSRACRRAGSPFCGGSPHANNVIPSAEACRWRTRAAGGDLPRLGLEEVHSHRVRLRLHAGDHRGPG